MIVAPSILSADFNELQKNIEMIEKYGSQFVHLDIMDGCFVPNFTFGAVVLENIKTNMIKDVHLMVYEPLKFAKYFEKIKPDFITYHYEAVNNQEETINSLKEMGVKVGVSIKPNTDVTVLDNLLDKVDMVLVMSVEPGFGGQKFIHSALDKIKYLKDKKIECGYKYLIEVDGGINQETGKLCAESGVEVLVAGSYIFKYVKEGDEKGLEKVISNLKSI